MNPEKSLTKQAEQISNDENLESKKESSSKLQKHKRSPVRITERKLDRELSRHQIKK
jgi:hypothetical protein